MNAYRIILADDHVMLRQGLRRILHSAGDFIIAGEADDGLQLLDLLRQEPADLALIDVSMPYLRGIDAIPEALAIQPEIRVLVLTMHRDLGVVRAALVAGARGYLVKEDAPTQLFAAIETIRAGGVFVSPRLSAGLSTEWSTLAGKGSSTPAAVLTARETEVLRMVADGRSSKEIATVLNISYRTVEHHRASIRAKLGLRTTADLVKRALEGGFL